MTLDKELELSLKATGITLLFAITSISPAFFNNPRNRGEYLHLNEPEKVIEFYDNKGEFQRYKITWDENHYPKIVYPEK